MAINHWENYQKSENMKKFNIIYLVLFLTLGLVSCEDEMGVQINPGAEDGTLSFQLNEPVYSNLTYVLDEANADANMDTLTCVQPDYGFTAAVTYTTQVSFSEDFTEGEYISLGTTVNGEKINVVTSEINTAIRELYGGTFPDPIVPVDVYIRLKAVISDATTDVTGTTLAVQPLYSNVIMLSIQPYFYQDLRPYTEVTPIPYYIIGMADGAWNNAASGLGVSIYPLSVQSGDKYNSDGNGEFTYTGYFKSSVGFKLIRDVGSWAEQWGSSDGALTPVHNDGGSQNFFVPEDGYYTIILNSITNEMSITAATITPDQYSSISMIGDVTDWSTDVELSASETENNHVWYGTYTFSANSASDGGIKFRVTGSWDFNWGAADFPVGLATSGGKNILYEAGTYVMIFNDIDGCYYFIKQ